MEITFSNLTNICRTCFSSRYLNPIANITLQEGINVADILIDFICMEDLYNDKLPQNMCSLCVEQLYLYYKFKERCKKNESLLKTYLKQEPIYTGKSILDIQEKGSKENLSYFATDNGSTHSDSYDDMTLTRRLEKPVIKKKKFRKNLVEGKLKTRRKKKTTELNIIHLEKCSDLTNQNGGNFLCKLCNKSFTFKYKLVMHMRVHTREKPFKCDSCPLSFSLNGNLKRHKMIHTGEKPHVCKTCGKGFIQATSLQTHSQKHRKENLQNRFTCNICCRVFIRAAPYKLHLKKYHSAEIIEKPVKEFRGNSEETTKQVNFECEICGKLFDKLVFLKRHTSRHGEKKFLCSDCGKGFVRKADLQSHVKIHTGERPHKCIVCNKSFAHTGSLVTHSLVHSGYRPFNCSLCSKTFTQLSHLKIHKRTHSGERPYSCSFCGKTFALKSNLTVHIRTHTGETPYLCSECGKGFYDSSSMKKHRLSHFNVSEAPAKKKAVKELENLQHINLQQEN